MATSWAAPIRAAAAAAARKHGTEVRELSGFATRGHADPGRLAGTVLHDTITPASWSSSRLSGLLRDGRADLPGPIANVQLDRDGALVLIAARKAHHAGSGSYAGIASGNGNACGIEAANAGRPERWTDRQLAVALTFVTELHRQTGADHRTAIGHLEWAPGRKQDPWSVDLPAFRAEVRARLSDPDPDPEPEDDEMTDDDRKLLRDVATRVERIERRLGKRNDDKSAVLDDTGRLRRSVRLLVADAGIEPPDDLPLA